MWTKRKTNSPRPWRFFFVAFINGDLGEYYQQIFSMANHHGYSIKELESMIPWERGIYVDLLIKHIEDENKKIEERNKRNQT